MSMKTVIGWLDWVLPAGLRSAGPVAAPADEGWKQLVAEARPTDPVLKGLVGMAREQFEEDNLKALQEGLSPERRQYVAGRAAAMLDFLQGVEQARREGAGEETEGR